MTAGLSASTNCQLGRFSWLWAAWFSMLVMQGFSFGVGEYANDEVIISVDARDRYFRVFFIGALGF